MAQEPNPEGQKMGPSPVFFFFFLTFLQFVCVCVVKRT